MKQWQVRATERHIKKVGNLFTIGNKLFEHLVLEKDLAHIIHNIVHSFHTIYNYIEHLGHLEKGAPFFKCKIHTIFSFSTQNFENKFLFYCLYISCGHSNHAQTTKSPLSNLCL